MRDLTPPRVFISYSHDSDVHCQRVLELAQELRRNGIDAVIDRFTPHPKEGWPRWMQYQIEDSDFVLAVCTAIYKRRFDGREEQNKGLGVNWEGFLTAQLIYENQALNERVIPIIFEDTAEADIPLVLRGSTHYRLPSLINSLIRRLTSQPEVIPAPLGQIPHMPPMFPPLKDAPVQSAGVGTGAGQDADDAAANNRSRSALDVLCVALETKYREISHRYTPLEIRKDLRVCPWEPRFIIRNPVKRQTEEKAEEVTLDYVETVSSFHRLVILGEPGCGKSTGLYAAAHKMAASRSEGLSNRVPVIVNLNRYVGVDARHPRDLLVEMIRDECNRALHASEVRIQAAALEEELRAGHLSLLFDGLNEVPASLRNSCIQSLVDFCDEFEKCRVTITSRKYMYNGELRYTAMEVLELGREDIIGFVEKHANDGGITANAILGVVDKTKWHLFQNPLALYMMVRVFQETRTIPINRALLIGSYVEIVLERHLSNVSRAGASSASKAEVKKGLTSIAELMAVSGLCLPSDQIERHLLATSQEPAKVSALLDIALESGLLVKEGGASRFWHHSIQEYFFVLGFYSHWKGYLGNEYAARKHIRAMLKRIEKWETISLAAGLMTEEETEIFLKECVAKDEYLTAMVLNHCVGIEAAVSTQKKIINKARVVSLLSYWAGSVLEWQFVVRVIWLLLMVKVVIRGTGYAFQEPISISLPLLGPWFTQLLLELTICIVAVMVLRRFSDYIVFARFNTIIRALQHIGSPETRSELMKVFKNFSTSARLELSYHTVINRVVASNICTQDELFEGLSHEGERLYCLTTLASVAEPTAMPVVCNVIHVERDMYALEAAVDCVVSIANKFPQCKDDEHYRDALRHAVLNQKLPIQSRLKAYAHFIEASGSAEDIPYPKLNRFERLEGALLSPRWMSYYLLLAVISLVLSQTSALALLVALFSWRDFGNFSGKEFIRLLLYIFIATLIPYLLFKIDLHFQQKLRNRTDRKWLSLGEATSVSSTAAPARTAPAWKVTARWNAIRHDTTKSIWRGNCAVGALHKVVSYGLRNGYAVDYLQADKVSLRLALRTQNSKLQVNPFYRIFSTLQTLFIVAFIFWIMIGEGVRFEVVVALLCVQFVDLVFWMSVNPYVSLVVSQVDRDVEVEGEIYFENRKFPVKQTAEAGKIMAEVIADIDSDPKIEEQPPVVRSSSHALRDYPDDVEDICWDVSNLLEELKLDGASADENHCIRVVADYLKNNSRWKIELSPRTLVGTPDILISDQLALDFLSNPDKTERDACVYRCASFSTRWAIWIILIDTPEAVVESLKDQLGKQGLEYVLVWNFPLN